MCIQIMHTGWYSTERETMKTIDAFIEREGMVDKLATGGRYHEICISDPKSRKSET